jgi:hypothetical protein
MTKELNCLKEFGEEKSFELSIIELVRYAVIIICIYSSPDGKIDTFLNKSELVIQRLLWSGDRVLVGARFFAHVQTDSGAHPTSCTMGTGSFPGVKRPGCGAEHPSPSSAKVENG